MIEKVGVYCRLSNEDKNKQNKLDDSNSIVNQKSMCIKFAKERDWNIVDIYSDDDFSGAGTYRPEFERLIADCESGKINLVLCKTQSRFSRDMEVIERYLHTKFVEWGVRFVSIVDNADTSIESNKKSRQMNSLVNEWYLADLSDNIKRSLKNKRENGEFIGSFAPYGYMKDPNDKHKLIVDPIAAEVVKKIFDMYANGYGYWKICKYLNDKGIPPRTVYKKQQGSTYVCSVAENGIWSPDSVAQMLKQEVYIGNLVQGRKTSMGYKVHKYRSVDKDEWCRVEGTHEALIDIDTWNIVQKRFGDHQVPVKNGKIHFFTRKVYCSCCDKSFQRNVYNVRGEKTGKRSYLQCRGHKRLHICENNKAIRIDELELIVLNAISEMLKKYYDQKTIEVNYELLNTKYSNNESKIKSLEKEKKNLNERITEVRSFFKKLYEDKLKGVLTDKMFIEMSNDYTKEIENHVKRIETIDSEIELLKPDNKPKKKAEDILKKYRKITKLNKVIVDEFIDRIYVGKYDKETKTRDIEIIWNFEF